MPTDKGAGHEVNFGILRKAAHLLYIPTDMAGIMPVAGRKEVWKHPVQTVVTQEPVPLSLSPDE
jgi:hypothetical protein